MTISSGPGGDARLWGAAEAADGEAGDTGFTVAGAVTADAVALEARKAAEANVIDQPDQSQDSAPAGQSVASLTARRLTQLPADTRPLPSVAAYDQLLRHRRKDSTS